MHFCVTLGACRAILARVASAQGRLGTARVCPGGATCICAWKKALHRANPTSKTPLNHFDGPMASTLLAMAMASNLNAVQWS